MKEYIYVLLDPNTNKIRYVGKTKDLNHRYSRHLSDNSKTHKTNWIKSLINDNLKPIMKVVGQYDQTIINQMEIFWIDYFKRCGCRLTNATIGGDGCSNPSAETRAKISAKLTGIKRSKETCKKNSDARKGIPTGRSHWKGVYGKDAPASKPVLQLNKVTNKIINEYNSIQEATNATGIDFRLISATCNGRQKTSGGYKWIFKTTQTEGGYHA